tara:strand:+ start:11367 stop:11468 length:102 start_codon:yes stop_codon:yes gene_type:complete
MNTMSVPNKKQIDKKEKRKKKIFGQSRKNLKRI